MANIAFEEQWRVREAAAPRTRPGVGARLGAALVSALDQERGRWIYWLPVLFACGIGLYFTLPYEPPTLAAVGALIGASAMRVFLRRGFFAFLAGSMLLTMACGFAAAKFRSDFVAAPLIAKSTATKKLEGWVERWEQTSAKRGRLTLLVSSAEGIEAAQLPHRVRITANATVGPPVGASVFMPAVLTPLSEPVMPRGFDFARQAWFSSIGAGGFATAAISMTEGAGPPPIKLRILAAISRARTAIGARIAAALPTSTAAIAQALIVGERAQMSEADTDALRASGLYHVISISGLHMALVAGSLFWLVRFGFALIPSLALRYPIKKWAAALAILGAFGYLLLSGSAVATLRSFLMIAVIFLAIALDRPAVTLRNVAFSALLILAVLPESLLDVSFQMSFAATAALIAFCERYQSFLSRRTMTSRLGRVGQATSGFLIGSVTTSLVAGLAVAPISAYHFYNVASYSVLGNLVGMPVITLVIMPMAILTLAVMPLGLEALPLAAMGWGIEIMLVISRWVAALDGAIVASAAYPMPALLAIALGGLWMLIWRGRWRYLGAAPLALGIALMPAAQRPDILVERQGAVIAVRDPKGVLQATPGRKAAYSLEQWLKADGDNRKPKDANKGAGFRCDASSCVILVQGKLVSLTREMSALADDCARADILIAPFPILQPCQGPKLIIDKRAFDKNGATAIYLRHGRIRVETAAQVRGVRPWAPRRHITDYIKPIDNDGPDSGAED